MAVSRSGAKAARLPKASSPLPEPVIARDNVDFPIVAIGASAGGLEAVRTLLDALPAGIGMAFILVQHLDPTHKSLLVNLLAEHTSLNVLQATDGMAIERQLTLFRRDIFWLSRAISCGFHSPRSVMARASHSIFC